MVDQALLDKLKDMRENPEAAGNEAALILFEVFKQLAEEDEDLKEEVEDAELCMQFIMMEGEQEGYKYWVSIRDGKLEAGEGDGPDVSVTLKASREVLAGMASREIDSTAAYMAGDLVIEGSLQDAMAFNEISSLAGDLIEELIE